MNKMIKGSIAGATGVALLMGGFGTYALWSDSEDLPDATASRPASSTIAHRRPAPTTTPAPRAANDWTAARPDGPRRRRHLHPDLHITGTGKNLEGAIDFVAPALDQRLRLGD